MMKWFCCQTLISSCGKSFSFRQGPCSRTTTLKPAVDNSFATTPPAAPEPTITKSTSSVGRNVAPRCCSGASGRCRCSARIGVVPAEWRCPGELIDEANQLPAALPEVAAVLGVGEHPDDRGAAQREEEFVVLLVHCRDDALLLRIRQRGKGLRAVGPRAPPQLRETLPESVPLVLLPGREPPVDEVDDARFPRAGPVVAGRNDLRRRGFDVRGVERLKVLEWRRWILTSRGGGMLTRGEQPGDVCGEPGRGE